ncbi:histone-fold-containing protein [Ochromonadaceae sp. CCMP2298]|nr:histone-fold-containing protein [Ochromonadaceae sp. CCMP2298]|mmetsp:Transcript_9061/g.19767  ORF Transcript_9061/g.19767 Transcript_9061/m.19767 type:complete len:97 (-) Transcript_9061:32-322(-)
MSGNNPDYEPPMACVSRVMKQSLPDNVLLTKDARAAFVRAAGIFIFYLTHCANDFCRESGRTTIFPQDIMAALKELHFEDFERPLEEFLEGEDNYT